jgi:hypothetical protein
MGMGVIDKLLIRVDFLAHPTRHSDLPTISYCRGFGDSDGSGRLEEQIRPSAVNEHVTTKVSATVNTTASVISNVATSGGSAGHERSCVSGPGFEQRDFGFGFDFGFDFDFDFGCDLGKSHDSSSCCAGGSSSALWVCFDFADCSFGCGRGCDCGFDYDFRFGTGCDKGCGRGSAPPVIAIAACSGAMIDLFPYYLGTSCFLFP